MLCFLHVIVVWYVCVRGTAFDFQTYIIQGCGGIADFITKHKVDILLLQEVKVSEHTQKLQIQANGRQYGHVQGLSYHGITCRSKTKRSRWPLENTEQTCEDSIPFGLLAEQRLVLTCVIGHTSESTYTPHFSIEFNLLRFDTLAQPLPHPSSPTCIRTQARRGFDGVATFAKKGLTVIDYNIPTFNFHPYPTHLPTLN